MGRLFGTDGVRGVANADLTAELALGLSVAAAHVLAEAGTFGQQRSRKKNYQLKQKNADRKSVV